MVPVSYFLGVAAALFAIGAIGVIIRRNALIALMSIELMLNAANLTLVAFARARHDSSAHVFAFLIIAIAAAEAAVGLAIILTVFKNRGSLEVDDVSSMKN